MCIRDRGSRTATAITSLPTSTAAHRSYSTCMPSLPARIGGKGTHAARGAPEVIEETDTRVHDATGGHPKVRAPASIFTTVSQSQAVPTSAGHMRAAILIPESGAARPNQNLYCNQHYSRMGREPLCRSSRPLSLRLRSPMPRRQMSQSISNSLPSLPTSSISHTSQSAG